MIQMKAMDPNYQAHFNRWAPRASKWLTSTSLSIANIAATQIRDELHLIVAIQEEHSPSIAMHISTSTGERLGAVIITTSVVSVPPRILKGNYGWWRDVTYNLRIIWRAEHIPERMLVNTRTGLPVRHPLHGHRIGDGLGDTEQEYADRIVEIISSITNPTSPPL